MWSPWPNKPIALAQFVVALTQQTDRPGRFVIALAQQTDRPGQASRRPDRATIL